MLSEVLIEKCSFYVSCQFNAKSGAIEQLRLGDRPVDRDRRVGHPWFSIYQVIHGGVWGKRMQPSWCTSHKIFGILVFYCTSSVPQTVDSSEIKTFLHFSMVCEDVYWQNIIPSFSLLM